MGEDLTPREQRALVRAARKVLDGLNARIDEVAAANAALVPVFDGIVELHDALYKAERRFARARPPASERG